MRISRAKWDRLVERAAQTTSEQAAEILRDRLKGEIYSAGRVQTGAMAHDWRIDEVPARTKNGTRFSVWSPYKRTIYQNFGTRGSRPIPPRKALRFQVGGRVVFATRTRPIVAARFMERALGSMTVRDWL